MRTHKHPRLRGYDYSQAGAYHVVICTHARAHLFGRVVNPADLAAEPYMDLNDAGVIVQRCWDAIPGHYPHVVLDAFQVMPNHVHGIIMIAPVTSPHGATRPRIVTSPHGATNDVPDPDGSGGEDPVASPHGATNAVPDPDGPGGEDPVASPHGATNAVPDPDGPGGEDPVASPHGATNAVQDPDGPGGEDPVASPHGASNAVQDHDGSGHDVPDGSRHAATLPFGGAPTVRGLANIVGSFKSAVTKGVNEWRGTPGAPVWQKGYYDHIIRDATAHDRIARYIAENPAHWTTDLNNR